MNKAIPPLLALAASTALLAVIYGRAAEPAGSPEVPFGHPPIPGSGVSAPEAAPSKENVSYAFRARLALMRMRLEDAPDDTMLLRRMARMLHDAHQPREAVVYYQRYLALNPSNRQMWLDLAGAHAALKQWDEAIRVSQSLLEISPGDPAAMYNLGAIHANRGNYEAAKSWWEKVRDQRSDETLAFRAAASLQDLSDGTALR